MAVERVRALLEAGLREHAQAKLEHAKACYGQALALEPDHPDALGLMGTALLQLGEAEAAVSCLERAARIRRNDARIRGNLAQAYFAAGRVDEARKSFERASRLAPNELQYRLGIANSAAVMGKLAEAEELLGNLSRRHPDNALIWFNLGNVLRDRGEADRATASYARAIDLDPGFVDAHLNLGATLHSQYRFDAAEHEYRACLAIDPRNVPAQLNLASVLIDSGSFERAEAVCRRVVAQAPEAPMAHGYLGAALDHQGKIDEAVVCHRLAAQLDPNDPHRRENYAVALANAGETGAALEEFERALALRPDWPATRFARANLLLSIGQLAAGWEDYAYRPAFVRYRDAHPDMRLARTLAPDRQTDVLQLLPEQGLGDELFFLRFARSLDGAGVRFRYHATPKLRSLLARSFESAQIADADTPPSSGCQSMLIGDLPLALYREGTEGAGGRAHFPEPLELHPLPAALSAIRARLAAAGAPPYVGVTWQAGVPPKDQRDGAGWGLVKQIPVDALAQALRTVPCTVLVLQRNPDARERGAFRAALGRTAHDFSALNDDLEEMLATLFLIDEYVGASNTNMHLRAGTGKTARVLVPRPAEWRWMAAGDASPWFPGFSIYRQSPSGDWAAAAGKLQHDLVAALPSGC